MTEEHVCEQLVHSRYIEVEQLRVKSTWSQVWRPIMGYVLVPSLPLYWIGFYPTKRIDCGLAYQQGSTANLLHLKYKAKS